jgi:BlaI family penicillinase repressor
MAKNTKPTESELEILKVLWQQGASTVREVNDELSKKREIGYTTTLKIMQIMTEKNLLNRDSSKRTHVFTANVSEQETQQKLLDKLLDSAFGGSALKLVMQALGNKKSSDSDLKEIRSLLDDLEKENKK